MMSLATDKASEIRAQIAVLQSKLDMLEAQDGKVLKFVDSLKADGALPDLPSIETIAKIVDRWVKFTG
jgi:hypothetical protein